MAAIGEPERVIEIVPLEQPATPEPAEPSEPNHEPVPA